MTVLATDLVPPAPPAAAVRPEARAGARERCIAAAIAAGCLAVLIIAAVLPPSDAGFGTHERLGLLPCSFLALTGKPCPTCGMTTAFSYMAHGHPAASFRTQPFGAALSIVTAACFWGCLHVAVFGSRLGWLARKLLIGRVLWPAVAFFLVSWAYKIVSMKSA